MAKLWEKRVAEAMKVEKTPEPDPVHKMLEAHGGDANAAIAGLLGELDHLRDQLALASLAVSVGYTRGWLPTQERVVD